jgi:hypothetical protein
LHRELQTVRTSLLTSAYEVLPSYLVFGAAGVHDLLAEALHDTEILPPRNKRARERERHLLLYLQRIAAKNDTFSEFGPSGWGISEQNTDGLRLSPKPGIARREAFFERWAAYAVAIAMNADAEIRPELAPRVNPNGRLEGNQFVLSATAKTIALEEDARQFLASCDGRTPAHATGASMSLLNQLAESGVIVWEAEVTAMDAVLVRASAGGRGGMARNSRARSLARRAAPAARAGRVVYANPQHGGANDDHT